MKRCWPATGGVGRIIVGNLSKIMQWSLSHSFGGCTESYSVLFSLPQHERPLFIVINFLKWAPATATARFVHVSAYATVLWLSHIQQGSIYMTCDGGQLHWYTRQLMRLCDNLAVRLVLRIHEFWLHALAITVAARLLFSLSDRFQTIGCVRLCFTLSLIARFVRLYCKLWIRDSCRTLP